VRPLARLRLDLTLWYAGVLTLMLALLGGGLFVAVRRQISGQLDASLQAASAALMRSEEHTSELQSLAYLVCRLLLEKKKTPHTSSRNRPPPPTTCAPPVPLRHAPRPSAARPPSRASTTPPPSPLPRRSPTHRSAVSP